MNTDLNLSVFHHVFETGADALFIDGPQRCGRKRGPMTHAEIRARHFERLSGYRNSVESAQYAREIGADIPTGDLPSLVGNRWEIDEQTYDEFLGVLPPLGWRNLPTNRE